jgi:exo-1,4-beta-D-glucosaminidase
MKTGLFVVLGVFLPSLAIAAEPAANTLTLTENWSIQSSASAGATGAAISTPAYKPRGWYRTTVPSTVVNALVRNEVYPDPYFGMNLRTISGTHYPISQNFSNIPMPPGSPFGQSWWYRTDFEVPASWRGKTLWLQFDGINFRANVWMNGRQIAASGKMAGAWRVFEFDVTRAAEPGRVNSLAVEVFPPAPDDLAITFVDWNPLPPDKNMGLWRPVRLAAAGRSGSAIRR